MTTSLRCIYLLSDSEQTVRYHGVHYTRQFERAACRLSFIFFRSFSHIAAIMSLDFLNLPSSDFKKNRLGRSTVAYKNVFQGIWGHATPLTPGKIRKIRSHLEQFAAFQTQTLSIQISVRKKTIIFEKQSF